jgi:protein ImuB
LGTLEEPITPRLPLPPYIAERVFAEPVTHEAFVLQTIEHLAAELAKTMEQRGDGARTLQVTLYRVDGAVRRLSVATSKPLRDPRALHRLFKERFSSLTDELDPGFGFDVVRLSVTTAEKTESAQTDLVSSACGSDDIDHLIDRLGVRFGPRRVQRLGFAESHIPEYAVIATPAARPLPQAVVEGALQQDTQSPARPLRLFERPEEIEAIAEVPDGPPARFKWRRVAHEIVRAEGPERIAMEWWRDDNGRTMTRDYFRVEDREGRRFWLYREGLFNRETTAPKWFVHGLFA